MKIDLSKLLYNQAKELEINDTYNISKKYYQNSDIVFLKPVIVFGKIKNNYPNDLLLELSVKGTMILKDSRTLEDIPYEYSIEIKESIDENEQIKQNILDIEPILWENIMLEVPIRIVSNEEPLNLSGEGWEIKEN